MDKPEESNSNITPCTSSSQSINLIIEDLRQLTTSNTLSYLEYVEVRAELHDIMNKVLESIHAATSTSPASKTTIYDAFKRNRMNNYKTGKVDTFLLFK
jgi:hypothetical protein